MSKPLRFTRILIVMSKSFLHGILLTCLFTSILLANDGNAQHKSMKEVIVSIDLEDATLRQMINALEAQTEFKFIYSGDFLTKTEAYKITLSADNKSVAHVLQQVASATGLLFQQNDGAIAVGTDDLKEEEPPITLTEPVLEQDISGKVTDEAGEPLPGASVLVKGTSIGVITDADGNYRISVPDEATTLVFSFVGYEGQEIEIGGRSVINVALIADVTTLGEIVVSTGYWQTEEKLNPGNIAKVSAKEIEQQPIATPLQALSGRMAGVNVVQRTGMPGGGVDIQIRGRNSLRSDGNAPLYIVDGIPIPSSTLLGSASDQVYNSTVAPINNFNPSDIESIEILKDADATAIYGSRGANGVVLITTKKGKPGKTSINISQSTGIGQVSNKMDLLNSEQYREMVIEGLANDGFDPVPDNLKSFVPSVFIWDSTRYTDWQEELIGGTANYNNTQLSLSGGNANTQFLLSGTYFRQTTVFSGDFGMNRGSGLLNLSHSSTNQKFSAALTLNYIAEKNNFPRIDPTFSAISLPPTAPEAFDSLGNLNFEDNTFRLNPYADLAKPYEAKRRTLLTNLRLQYQIMPDLVIKANLGYNNALVDEIALSPIRSQNPSTNPTGSFRSSNSYMETWILEPQIEYNREIGSGQFSVLTGVTFQSTVTEQESLVAGGYTNDALLGNINAANIVELQAPGFSEYKYNALFARLNYNWKNKYIVNVTGRRDGSSRFGPNYQFGNFGAVGAAWIFSNEDIILSALPFISFGKLRVSYGTTGSDQLPDYEFLETHEPTSFSYLGTVGLIPTRLPNDDFGWEENKKIEGGIELGFIDDRIFITTSYYRNRSSNQLLGTPLAATTGFSSVRSNFPATVQNTGWEFELNTINTKMGEFQWSTSINLTIPRNKLIEFPDIEASTFFTSFTVGESLFNLKGFTSSGVDSETGIYSFEDLNEDGQLTIPEDYLPVREAVQDYFGGISNTFSYKGFSVQLLFQFVKQTGFNYRGAFAIAGTENNQPVEVNNRWKQPGDMTDIQKFTFGLSRDVADANSNYFLRGSNSVEDASFIRLQNVSLTYSLPNEVLDKLNGLGRLQIFIQGQNLLTITDYKGLDPETQNSQVIPPLRILTAGINVGL